MTTEARQGHLLKGLVEKAMVSTVFCDDAGFTGDNLLNPEQPFFAYAAVAIEAHQATALVAELRRLFSIGADELKGKNLYKRGFAPQLIERLSGALGGRTSIALNHKLFSLAAKFYEYVYEPMVAPISSFFYERGTHLYVATALWAYLDAQHPTAKRVGERFEAIMRRRAGQPQLHFDSEITELRADEAIEPIVRFAAAYRDRAIAELEDLADESGRIKFVLDLSFSSAKSVLATLGERLGELDVVMDDSKPLEKFAGFFDNFVGRSDTVYMELRGRRVPLTFHLHRPLRFGSSETEAGLQIADIFASFAALAARDRFNPRGAAILQTLLPLLDGDSVFPDFDAIDLRRKEVVMNMSLVSELADRAEARLPLLENIDAYHETMSHLYNINPPDFGEDD